MRSLTRLPGSYKPQLTIKTIQGLVSFLSIRISVQVHAGAATNKAQLIVHQGHQQPRHNSSSLQRTNSNQTGISRKEKKIPDCPSRRCRIKNMPCPIRRNLHMKRNQGSGPSVPICFQTRIPLRLTLWYPVDTHMLCAGGAGGLFPRGNWFVTEVIPPKVSLLFADINPLVKYPWLGKYCF